MKAKMLWRACGVMGVLLIMAVITGVIQSWGEVTGMSLAVVGAACTLLDGNLTIDCDDPIQGGVEDLLYLANKDDIDVVTRDNNNPLIVNSITLKSGATLYKVEGQNNSNNSRWELVIQRFTRVWNHFVDFVGFDLSPAAKARYEKIAKGKFVAFVVNNYKGTAGDSAIDVFGLDAGLVAGAISRDASSADTQGSVPISLQTDENGNKEPRIPATFYDGNSFATSLEALEALL